MVITPPVFLSLFLEMLQFCLVHHLLHQVLLPPHAIAQILRHVRNQVRNEGLDAEHQVLQKKRHQIELMHRENRKCTCWL